ncbi:MAG: Ribose-5-phosphate isomerase B [Syntrophaceae bacterium PtaU1.Bin231]|nr:MAG: Ribose-5-phosphate isomerase B [Syntrophaceae bacterium PtaU1.Bin231]HOG17518.1 ribose 5-phosphate isomerase B [Syntrophales bacterium]
MPEDKRLVIGADHAGFELKEALKPVLARLGYSVDDVGAFSCDAVDYPDIAAEVARRVSTGAFARGILVCGSGIGMSIAANRFPGVRAALCMDVETARLSRQHNNANILVLAGRRTGPDTAAAVMETWLQTPFEGGRHQRRLEKIAAIENSLKPV